MFKNIVVYRTNNTKFTKESLIEALSKQQFTSCSSLELTSSGWVSPRQHGELVNVVDGRFLMKLVSEKKVLPSSVVKETVIVRAEEVEHNQGFYPGRKQLKEIKENVIDELLPRAFSTKTSTYVWIDPVAGLLFIDTSTNSKAEQAIKPLLAHLEGIQLSYLRTTNSPTTAMTQWLSLDIDPDSFSIDQDGVLESMGQNSSTVKYVKHSLDNTGVKQHIASGKQCTSLALTWENKISFVLTDTLQVKKIRPLDVLKENNDNSNSNDSERFDAEFVMMSGELAKLVIDLISDLGGEYKENV